MSNQAPPKEENVPQGTNDSRLPKGDVTPADAIPDLGSMTVRQVGFNQYNVEHNRKGKGNTLYRVDLYELECSCPDWHYNTEGYEPCKHMSAAMLVAETHKSEAQIGILQALDANREVTRKVDELMARLSSVSASEASQGDSASADAPSSIDPDEAADRLQTAYDSVTTGMKVEAHDGRVWINKSPDAPDWTFEAFLQEPELVKYAPDESPKQYFKNYIQPEDVEAYIEEVLE